MLLIFVVLLQFSLTFSQTQIVVDVNSNVTDFNHFWESTGLCPPDPKENIYKFLLSKDETFNLALIGSLPNQGIKHVRIHWLFHLIFISDNGYNFTYLDQMLDLLVGHNLKPRFELMGYPVRNNDSNIEVTPTKEFWADLVKTIAERYIERYNVAEVASWRFELWNEPDLKNYNILNFTLPAYLDYVEGCYEGLQSAFGETAFTLGGPAGLFRDKNHPLCWGLLDLCSGNPQCPIQFISFHRKGDGTAEGVLNGTLELLDLVYNKYPDLRRMPIANDESDIITTWSNSWEWLADARYAAMVVKVLADHYKSLALSRKLQIELLSNDNAFLNYHPYYFTQRTLFARFQMNLTHPPHDQFIKKPIYSLMGMLSLLENAWLNPQVVGDEQNLTVLATGGDQSNTAILLAYANSDEVNIETINSVRIDVNNLSIGCKFTVYLLDNLLTNPYQRWMEMGAPAFPVRTIRTAMREAEGPHRLFAPTSISGENLSVNLNLTIPSVALIHICRKPITAPGVVTRLSIFNVTRNEVLLMWSDSQVFTKCIRTYEIEFESVCANSLEFVRVNPDDTIFLSYHHAVTGDASCEPTIGRYRVRAIDYWDQAGDYSEIVSFP